MNLSLSCLNTRVEVILNSSTKPVATRDRNSSIVFKRLIFHIRAQKASERPKKPIHKTSSNKTTIKQQQKQKRIKGKISVQFLKILYALGVNSQCQHSCLGQEGAWRGCNWEVMGGSNLGRGSALGGLHPLIRCPLQAGQPNMGLFQSAPAKKLADSSSLTVGPGALHVILVSGGTQFCSKNHL